MIKISKSIVTLEAKKLLQIQSLYKLRTAKNTMRQQGKKYSEKAIDPNKFTQDILINRIGQ